MADNITINVNGKEVTAAVGSLVGDIVAVDRPCAGHGRCGKCRVIAHGALSEPTENEKKLLTSAELDSGIRLACRTRILGECSIETTADKNVDSERILTDGSVSDKPHRSDLNGYGAAIDIGTTTVAALLFDKEGNKLAQAAAMNPQTTFGGDVISRIEASVKGKSRELAEVIRAKLNDLLTELAAEAAIDSRGITRTVITGNTAMLYLLTETPPLCLSRAPFEADRLFGETLSAKDLGLDALAGDSTVILAPCISAFVGADVVCGILTTDMTEADETTLLVDIGTNGEMALRHDGELIVCSTAAGPAFEGAGISMGMRGGIGAVDRVSITDDRLTAHVIGEGRAVGICGSGLVDAVACLLDLGTLDETGCLDDDTVTIIDDVTLNAADIRMIQLAKSAIYSGIMTLTATAGTEPSDIKKVYIAGGFGAYLDLESAAKIGLIPNDIVSCAVSVGNSALSGASLLLKDSSMLEKARKIAGSARTIDLSSNPTFAELYMMSMLFGDDQ